MEELYRHIGPNQVPIFVSFSILESKGRYVFSDFLANG
jgi:hypothetical protein